MVLAVTPERELELFELAVCDDGDAVDFDDGSLRDEL